MEKKKKNKWLSFFGVKSKDEKDQKIKQNPQEKPNSEYQELEDDFDELPFDLA